MRITCILLRLFLYLFVKQENVGRLLAIQQNKITCSVKRLGKPLKNSSYTYNPISPFRHQFHMQFVQIYNKAKNHVTHLLILYLYSDRTGKKMVHYFLNTQHTFKYLIFVPSKRTLKYFMLRVAVFCTTSSKDLLSLLEVVWKTTASVETALR